MKESARYILQILVFVALILVVGTVGYLLIEDEIGLSDAFYMAVTAITPAQFEEVHTLSVPGRYFTVVLVFCGFGAVVAFATQFARLIIQSELEGVGVITRKQMRRRINRMKNHYIVCGFGEIGGAICGELKDQELPFVVITDDETSIVAISRDGYALVQGNPTADASLKEAQIERASGVIAVLENDSDNLFISLAARELNPKIFIIARGEDSSIEDRILRAGADIVVSPMKLGGRQIAGLINQESNSCSGVNGSSSQSKVMGLGLTAYCHATDDPTPLADVINQAGVVGAAGIHRRDGSFEPTPSNETLIQPDDVVVLISKTKESDQSFHKQSSGKKILLADDHRALRLLYSRKLASAGHEVIQAATGDEALALALDHSPDLVVLDVNMPEQDGYQVCKELRLNLQFSDVTIILYSGEESTEFVRLGLEAGADICVRKTSKSSELLARIEEAFLRSHSRQAARNADQTLHAPSNPTEPPGKQQSVDIKDQHVSNHAFDIEVAIENAAGDRQLLDELIQTVLEETPKNMTRIGEAISRLDHTALRLESHSLKSSVAILGADKASATAAKLELAGGDCDQSIVEQLHIELKNQIEELTTALELHAQQVNVAGDADNPV